MSRRERYPGASAFVSEREDLIALARSVVGSAAIAEELVQDSWLRWQSRAYPTEAARPIFRRIVINLARDWRRKDKRETLGLTAFSASQGMGPDTEQIVITRDELAIAIGALKELPERTLAAFRMHRLEGATYEEIGKRLSVSTPRAFQLVRRALVHIAMRLEPEGAP